jgi:hypothetical protein
MASYCKLGSWLHLNLERARRIAKIREDLHLNHKSHRPLSPGYEVKGAFGEIKFSEATGLPVDEERRIAGDRGIDFLTAAGPVDVKTASIPKNLIIEEGKVVESCIYVLAGIDQRDVHFIGWEFGGIMCCAEIDDGKRFKNGVVNRFMPRSKLRPMPALWELLRLAILAIVLVAPAWAFDYDTTGSRYKTPTDFGVYSPNPQRGWCSYGGKVVYQTRDYHADRERGTGCFFPNGNDYLPDVRPPAFQSIFRDPEWWEKGEGYRGNNEADRNEGGRP